MSIPSCAVPCRLPHGACRPATRALATAALAHLIASVIYLVLTRRAGTPLRDSFSAEQRAIQRASARVRGRAYLTGLVLGALVAGRLAPRGGA